MINIKRNFGVRSYDTTIWLVDKGKPYDKVEVIIDGYTYYVNFAVPINTSENELQKIILKYITEKDIEKFKNFIKRGERYDW